MPNSRIYIGKLSRDATEKDVEKYFEKFGEIKEINLKNNKNSRYECGFGFVEFNDYRYAEDAVKECNDTMFFDHRIIVEIAHGEKRSRDDRRDDRRSDRYGPPQRTNYRVLVDNLSSSVSWQDLKDFFRKVGRVTFADAHKRREGEGVVEFASYDDMKYAIRKLDETELKGRKMYLSEDTRSRRRSRSRSRSRSRRSRSHYSYRSRSRTRSRSRSRSDSSYSRRSRSTSRSHSRYRSRSRSPRSRSHSISRSPRSRSRSRSESPRSRSRSPQSRSPSRSRSNSPRSRSRSRSHTRSRSRSQSQEVHDEELNKPISNNEEKNSNSPSSQP